MKKKGFGIEIGMPVAAFPSDGIYPNEPLVLDINKDGQINFEEFIIRP